MYNYIIIKKICLPEDILNIVLEYIGYHKNRNGKYMQQLHNNLPIYKMLKNKAKIINEKVELFIKYVKRRIYCKKMIVLYYDNNYKNNNIINYDCGLYEYCNYSNQYYQIETFFINNKSYDFSFIVYI